MPFQYSSCDADKMPLLQRNSQAPTSALRRDQSPRPNVSRSGNGAQGSCDWRIAAYLSRSHDLTAVAAAFEGQHNTEFNGRRTP